MTKSTLIKCPSVLAFEKKISPSDALFYATNWDELSNYVPVSVHEKSVRGTISNRLTPATANDPLKTNAEVEKPNLQRVDACNLPIGRDTLCVKFSLKFLGGLAKPSACNSMQFLDIFTNSINHYKNEHGFLELAKRYASNIANARFLWRNRFGSERIQVNVKVNAPDHLAEQAWTFDACDFSLSNFDHENEALLSLSKLIADTLSSDDGYLLLQVESFVMVGDGQDVFPSEEMLLDKSQSKDSKGKILYAVDGVAAMHSQKIGNAIRTIDTWYPCDDLNTTVVLPIAVEPYGAVTTRGMAFRQPKSKKDFYSLLSALINGNPLHALEDWHYIMSIFIRGGVFGEADKEK